MKTRLSPLLLVLAQLLFGGCADVVSVTPDPAVIYSGDPTNLNVDVKSGGSPWTAQTQVIMTSDDNALVFPPINLATRTATLVIYNATGTGTQSAAAGTVDHDTVVNVTAKWRTAHWSDPTATTTVTVLPPVRRSLDNGDGRLVVAPAIHESETFVYVITALDSAGQPQPLIGVTLKFDMHVTLTVQATTWGTKATTSPPVSRLPNNEFYVDGSAVMESITVTAVAADASRGGKTNITGYISTAIKHELDMPGPKP